MWGQTLRELGYPEDKIRAFIPSSAYAAWWHMGNLEGAGGPVSDAEIENEVKLGQQIVSRMRELGMTPVLPGFVGILPHDIGQYAPELKGDMIEQGDWNGYQRPIVLKPTSAQFPRIAAIWYKNLRQVYGDPLQAYGGDLFHEGGKVGDTNVTQAATAVQTAMQTASPGSKWLVQGWQSNPKPQLLAGLDPKNTEVLQLSYNVSNNSTTDRGLRTYDGQPWLWCELANFGARQGLYGGVPFVASLSSVLLDPAKNRGQMQGVGLLSEGIEQNPLYYDVFFDQIWRSQDVKLDGWLDDYTTRRYGNQNAPARQALQLLMDSGVYSPPVQDGVTETILCARPAPGAQHSSSWTSGQLYYDPDKITQAAKLLLQAAPQLKSEETYRYDLVDWTRQVISDLARPTLADAMAAYDQHDLTAFNHYAAQYLDLLRDSDRLLASDRYFLLGTWIESARAKGTTPEEKARMEENARTLVTTWSGKIDSLNDYSHHQWAGLMGDYYLPRWQAFFDDYRAVLEGKMPATQLNNWYATRRGATDLAFAKATKTYATQPQGDAVAIATELLAKYAPLSRDYAKQRASSKSYSWKLAPGISTFTFNVNDAMLEAGTYRAILQWKTGDSALQSSSLAFYEGDKKVAEDVHEGWTGIENHGNAYVIQLPTVSPDHAAYTIQAQVKGASSTNSAGTLTVVKTK